MERECLALVWAIRRFSLYLYGRGFTVQTDHQPLKYLAKAKLENSRILRWALVLQEFDFRVVHIKGVENLGADFLSRV